MNCDCGAVDCPTCHPDEQLQHQPWSPPDSDEEVMVDAPRALKRSKVSFGGKRPYAFNPGGYSVDDETPDLGSYFEEWNLSERKQILMCRGYASYLAAKQDARKK